MPKEFIKKFKSGERVKYKNIKKFCINCGCKLKLNNNRDIERKNFCCRSCSSKYYIKIGKIGSKGKKFSIQSKEKMRIAKFGKYFGENNPHYKNGNYIGESLYRKIAMDNYKQECSICGRMDDLEVHHIDKNHKNNQLNNLVILCPRCHSWVHHGKIRLGGENSKKI